MKDIANEAEDAGRHARLFPVALHRDALGMGLEEQALRWDHWEGDVETRTAQLIRELTYEFCRMLRHYLEHLVRPAEDEARSTGTQLTSLMRREVPISWAF